MAFNINNLVRWSNIPVDPAVNPNPMNPPPPLPQWWGYKTDDTIATVSANGYFRYYADFFASSLYSKVLLVGDIIYCVCSDGNVQLTVLTVDPQITTAATTVSANTVNTAAIQNAAVTTPKIADANVTLAKLAAGITPSHVIKFGAQHTTVGGAAAEAIVINGVLATDLAFVQLVDEGTNTVTVSWAVCTANTLTITFSADPGNDAIVNYQIIRAAA